MLIPFRNELYAIVRSVSSVSPSVNICTNCFFFQTNGWIATKLAHDGPQWAWIQDMIKVKLEVKGHVIWALLSFHKNPFFSQANGSITTKFAQDTGWSLDGPASRICSRSRLRSKFTWYGHFCDFTKKTKSLLLPGNGWIVNKLTTSLTSPSLSLFPFLLHPSPQMAASLHCEFCHSSHREAVCQTVCYTVWSHVLSLHAHTLWSTITLSFLTQY